MADQEINSFSADLMRRIMRVVTKVEGNLDAELNKRRRSIVGGDGCERQNAVFHVTVFGRPTVGSFIQRWTVDGVTEPITFAWNDDAADVKVALATHSKIASTDLNVLAGPYPNATMTIEFKGELKNKNIAIPDSDWDNLTGGLAVAVITSLVQRGHK